MRTSAIALTGILLITALLSACNGTDDNGDSSTTTTESPTGVWTGTDSTSGLSTTAIINAAGLATFIESNGIQYVGTVQVSGSTIAASVDGYATFGGTAFSDGSTYGIGTVNGTVSTGGTLSATLTFTTNDGTAISGDWSLTYTGYAGSASSPAATSGNYTDSVTGAVVSINSNGVLTSQNATNGCVLNGSISTNDTSHDVYEVAYTLEDCTGSYDALNGVQFTGLATLNPTSPAQLILAVSGASSTAKYGIVSSLNGS
jgi:hypothetical protein